MSKVLKEKKILIFSNKISKKTQIFMKKNSKNRGMQIARIMSILIKTTPNMHHELFLDHFYPIQTKKKKNIKICLNLSFFYLKRKPSS